MALDMNKLIAIMRMTESSSDGEALNALRHANRLLKAEEKHWGDVLAPAKPPLRADYRTPPSKRKTGAGAPRADTSRYGRAAPRRKHNSDLGRNSGRDIDEMLSELGGRKHDMGTLMFLASLNDHWERKDYLTDAQYDSLKQLHAGRVKW
jgi:chromatin segregation and condensation protein Rec8/ScpA/Scc1 (kleisin family)